MRRSDGGRLPLPFTFFKVSLLILLIINNNIESTAELYLGMDQFVLGNVVAQEMQWQHCVYCMKGTGTTTIKSI